MWTEIQRNATNIMQKSSQINSKRVRIIPVLQLISFNVSTVYSLLPPTQPAPALSQPACVSETDGVSEWLRCTAEIEDREWRKKKSSREEMWCLLNTLRLLWLHGTSWGCEPPPSSPRCLWLRGHTSEGCILEEGDNTDMVIQRYHAAVLSSLGSSRRKRHQGEEFR